MNDNTDRIPVKYLNLKQVRRTMNPINFNEDMVSPAHTQAVPGFTPYVPKSLFDAAVAALTTISLGHGEPAHHARNTLNELGIKQDT